MFVAGVVLVAAEFLPFFDSSAEGAGDCYFFFWVVAFFSFLSLSRSCFQGLLSSFRCSVDDEFDVSLKIWWGCIIFESHKLNHDAE